MIKPKQWFCTKCKAKFESDRDRPNCADCDSGYVLCNDPIPPLWSVAGQGVRD